MTLQAIQDQPLVSVSGLSKSFDLSAPFLNRLIERKPKSFLRAVDGLDIDIPRGKTFSLVGESGCGKSTVAKLVVGLHRATGGAIRFDGTDLTDLRAADRGDFRRRIQMIFQDPMSSLNPRRRVGGIIAGPLRLQGLDNIDARVSEALDMVGLPRTFARRYPHELSGGQRQRVGIARAIALRPRFILADEIVSGLDVSSQAQVLNLLEELVREFGLTLAFISHDLSVVRRLCNRVLVLHHGEIVEEVETSALFDNPKADYTRSLLGAIPLPDPDQVWL